MSFNMKQMRHRIKQSTTSLMEELGGEIVECKYRMRGGEARRYAYRKGDGKVLAVAHCDSVDHGSDHFCYDNDLVFSSRLDDRLGVFVILDVLPKLGINVDVLLTDFEESGGSTGQDFADSIGTDHPYNWMFQFDRHGGGVVHYQYMNMVQHMRPFFKDIMHGSYTDICGMDAMKICGANFGTAYYQEHTMTSHAALWELANQVEAFGDFFRAHEETPIPHKKYSKPVALKSSRSTLRAERRVRRRLRKNKKSINEMNEEEILVWLDSLPEDQREKWLLAWENAIDVTPTDKPDQLTDLEIEEAVDAANDIARANGTPDDKLFIPDEDATLKAWRDGELAAMPVV